MTSLSLPLDQSEMQLRQCELIRNMLNSTLFPLAVKDVKKGLLEEFASTELEDAHIREMVWHEIKLLDKLIGRLRSYANIALSVEENNKRYSNG